MIWLFRLFELPPVPLLATVLAVAWLVWMRRRYHRVVVAAGQGRGPDELASSLPFPAGRATRLMLDQARLPSVGIERGRRPFATFYDPGERTVRLSMNLHDSGSAAALARAAHEVGHAIQDQTRSPWLALRVPMAMLARLSIPTAVLLTLTGFVLGVPMLLEAGLWVYPATVAGFAVVSRLIERNASERGAEALSLLAQARGGAEMPSRAMADVLAMAAWADLIGELRIPTPAATGGIES